MKLSKKEYRSEGREKEVKQSTSETELLSKR